MTLIDSFGRRINYLRLSVTDHCNLHCCYCMSAFSKRRLIDRCEISSYEEIFKTTQAFVAAGISTIRITCGEPLMRRGIADFCQCWAECRC